jgi:glycosyltransferase involved in cell wall biosynthesis
VDLTQEQNHVVSIIIPTYNYGIYLSTAIQSCLNQTYKPIEIIIVDDGSTDNTKDLIKEFNDSVIYFFQNNSGVSAARNKGLELAKGNYLAFLDSDDYLTKDSIEVKMEILKKYPDIGIVFSPTYSKTFGQEGLRYNKRFKKFKNPITSDRFYEDLLLRKIPFQPSANLMRSSLAKKFRFPTNLSNGEDVAFFVKIFFSTKGYYLPKPTAVNIRHPKSLRHNTQEIKKDEFIETVFGDPFYKGALDYLRSTCTAHRYLELSRRFSLSGQTKLAREYYLKAVSENPKAIFKLKYLAKLIRAYLQ